MAGWYPAKSKSYRRASRSGSPLGGRVPITAEAKPTRAHDPLPRSGPVVQALISQFVSVARSLERRLERLIESVAGRVFSGRLHPSELAGKLAREADFARFDHVSGPATANLFVIQVNPRDLTVEAAKLEKMLAAEMAAYTTEEGLRLEGPVMVRIETNEQVPAGRSHCHVEVMPGDPVVWAHLVGGSSTLDVGRNRALIGRSPECDVVIDDDDVSRQHALLYREGGKAWIRDLSSANGTTVDGQRLGPEAAPLQPGSIVGLSQHRYRFVEV